MEVDLDKSTDNNQTGKIQTETFFEINHMVPFMPSNHHNRGRGSYKYSACPTNKESDNFNQKLLPCFGRVSDRSASVPHQGFIRKVVLTLSIIGINFLDYIY